MSLKFMFKKYLLLCEKKIIAYLDVNKLVIFPMGDRYFFSNIILPLYMHSIDKNACFIINV